MRQAVATEADEGALSRLLSIADSLRQREVFRVAGAYAVAAWLVIQVIDIVGPAFDIPEWVMRAAVLVSLLGFAAIVAAFPLVRNARRSATRQTGRGIIISALIIGLIGAAILLSWRTIIASEQRQIAVLPFADLSPNHDKAYLAEGISEQILSSLGKLPDLKVVGRSTAAAIGGEAAEPAELRNRLGITHLLEGSVRTAGGHLRLAVRLIETGGGTEQWSEEFEGSVDDVFGFQDRVAKVIAARLSTSRAEETDDSGLTSGDAYNLYLAARQIARTRTEPELKRAYSIAQRLVRSNPDYAPGLSLLAELSFMLSDAPNSYGSIPVERARSVGVKLARRAVELAPEEGHGYAALGVLATGEEAHAFLDKAIERDPSRSELYLWKALAYDEAGRFAEAVPALKRAVDIDPLWVGGVNRLAVDLAGAGRRGEATAVVDTYQAKGGDEAAAGRMRTNVAHLGGDLSETVTSGLQTLRINPSTPYVPRYVTRAMHFLGLQAPGQVVGRIDDQFPRLLWTQGVEATARSIPSGADVWTLPSNAYYVFALGAKRDWPALVALYDRKTDKSALCNVGDSLGPTFATALRAVGRTADSQKLIGCLTKAFGNIRLAGPRHFEIVDEAQVAALRGDEGRTFSLLDQAVTTGWLGASPRLTDYPAFDGFVNSPRYAKTQGLIDAWIEREKRELSAGGEVLR